MFYRPNNLVPDRIQSNPNDVASTLFVIDVIHSENFKNPVIPIPVRVDKVSNGEFTHIVLPSTPPQVVQDDTVFSIDTYRFFELGFQNLMSYAALKFKEITYRPLNEANLSKWWENTRKYTCTIPTYTTDLDKSLQAYLTAYLKWQSTGDMIGALLTYAESIIDLCNMRITSNKITYQLSKKETSSRMFTERKDGKKLPQIWQVDRKTFDNTKVRKKAFIPLLIYDDLLECFLSNKAELERGEIDIIGFPELENLKVIGIHPTSVNDRLKKIHLSSSRFDKVLVNR